MLALIKESRIELDLSNFNAQNNFVNNAWKNLLSCTMIYILFKNHEFIITVKRKFIIQSRMQQVRSKKYFASSETGISSVINSYYSLSAKNESIFFHPRGENTVPVALIMGETRCV